MITRRDKVAVGVFVVATTVILIGFLGVLWGIQASKPYKRYYVVTDSSVSGLSPSAAVKYLGVDAGKVESMQFDPDDPTKVRLTLAVTLNTPVKKDTKAQLQAVGITGLQIIELVRGESKDDLAPGSEIPFLQSKFTDIVTKIDRLSGTVDEFVGANKENITKTISAARTFLETSTAAVASSQQTITHLAKEIDEILQENRSDLRSLFASARTTMDDVAKITRTINDRKVVEDLTAALADARRAINELEGTVRDVRSQLNGNVIGDTIADVRSTARAATDAVVAARTLVTKVGGKVEDDIEATGRVLEQLTRTARSLEELSREIKERPALLIRDLDRPRREVVDK